MCAVCAIPVWASIVLACGVNRVHSSVGWMRLPTVGVLKVRHREYARSGNWTRPCSFMPLSSAVAPCSDCRGSGSLSSAGVRLPCLRHVWCGRAHGKSDLHNGNVCYLKVNMVHSGLAGRASLASKRALDKVRRRSARVQSTGPGRILHAVSISSWACGSCTEDNCQVSFSISDACTAGSRL